MEPGILSLGEAWGRLSVPFGAEDFALLTGDGVLVVDLPADDPPGISPTDFEAARGQLRELACPTIAIRGAELSAVGAAVLDDFDLVVGNANELNELLRAMRHSPQASLALVQLLRQSAGLDIHQGLIAESLVYSMLQAGEEFKTWRASRKIRTPEPASGPAVLIERRADILRLVLNRPQRHNAFSVEIREAFMEGMQLAASDPSIREIELSGNGPSFCSGGDLDEFGSFPDPATAHAIRSTRSPARAVARLADRMTVRVHGACIGAGMELPAFTRHVRADANAFFQLPEVSLGLVPGAGGSVSLPPRIGRQRTAWLAITGTRLDAEQALAWGLIDEIVSS